MRKRAFDEAGGLARVPVGHSGCAMETSWLRSLAVLLVVGAPIVGQQESDPAQRARQLVRRIELPGEARAAIRELVELGPAALPPLHEALRDPRPEVVQWALFATTGLAGDIESLREPLRLLMAHKDLGVALAASRAFVALEGKGRTLLADYPKNSVVEFDAADQPKVRDNLPFAMSVMPLAVGHLLVSVHGAHRVVELDGDGAEIWSFGDLNSPSDAERLPNGNTLIADSGQLRVVEVDGAGNVVWTFAGDIRPIDVDRLGNGNTLICSYNRSGVVEVDPQGKIVWQLPGGNVRDADRFPDGTTLVTLTDERRVVLVDAAHKELQQWKIGFGANDAELLPDGHLLVSGEGRAVELDGNGKEVWRQALGYGGRVTRCGRRIAPKVAADEADKKR